MQAVKSSACVSRSRIPWKDYFGATSKVRAELASARETRAPPVDCNHMHAISGGSTAASL